MRAVLFSLLMLVGAWATAPDEAKAGPAGVAPDSLNAIAESYVMLILDIGELEPGYVDAYYGPAEWQVAARAETETPAQLIERAGALTDRLAELDRNGRMAGASPAEVQRRKYLAAHVSAAAARLRMISGEVMSFADEAEALFGIRPELPPLESFDPVLAEIDALQPAIGALAQLRAQLAEDDHRRVREASLRSGESLRMRFRCEPSLPVYVIGLIVLLPAPTL